MKKLLLSVAVSTLLLSACSKNEEVVSTIDANQQETVETVAALQKSGSGLQGSWSFCHDKTLTDENVVESCNLYDAFVWQFDDGEITVGKVISPLTTENCTTQCYDAALANIQLNNLANGVYTEEEGGFIVNIQDSKDLANFPKCQVKWNVINEVDEQHQQWQLENVSCTTPIYTLKHG